MPKTYIELTEGLQNRLTLLARAQGLELSDYLLVLLLKSMPERTDATREDSFESWREADVLRIGNHAYQKVRSHDLYRFYVQWCKLNSYPPISHLVFSKHMSQTGISKGRDSAGNYYWATCNAFEKENKQLADSYRLYNGLPLDPEKDAQEQDEIDFEPPETPEERHLRIAQPKDRPVLAAMYKLNEGRPLPSKGSKNWDRLREKARALVAEQSQI